MLQSDFFEAYCLTQSSLAPNYITEAERKSHLNSIAARMLSGPLQGQLLGLMSQMLQPKRVIDIGSYSGYSALWLAQGLAPDGQVHTLEIDDEKEWLIRSNIAYAKLEDRIELHIGDAMDWLKRNTQTIDLVYIDADKERYIEYYETVMPYLRPGGLILADNVLWKGMLPNETKDRLTEYLEAFNAHVLADPRTENQILPLRDGLLWARKL